MSQFAKTKWLNADEAKKRIKNIFCVGRNYRDHAVELGNDVPSQPLIFGKSTHALAAADGVIELPVGRTNIHHEVEIVLYIGKDYHPGVKVDEIVQAFALGLDLTDRDAQSRLKKAGQPWEFAKGFRNSAVISDFYQIEQLSQLQDSIFSLEIDGRQVQAGSPKQMIFDFQTLIDYVGTHFALSADDILYTGTPAGVGPLSDGQTLQLKLDDAVIARAQVKITESF